jgi:hypothetical protein
MPITKIYNPLVVDGNPNLTPPTTTQPIVTLRDHVIFTYPYVSPVLTLQLRCPTFNNKHFINMKRVFKRTRGNTLIATRMQSDPITERLAIAFEGLTPTEASDFLTFISESLGKEIGYEDFETRQWKGVILNPEEAINQQDICSYSARVEFQGVIV